jgi:predicted AlkP superfamily phosphohydrolase/phosphomutase
VIVIGLDGLDPSVAEPLLTAGELPALASLRARGGLVPVATTSPAQTPVAWSTFATGTNPGGHGVFDFLRRDSQSYRPDSALNRHEQRNPFVPPRAVNLRRGVPVWQHLADAGVGSVVVRCPCTYPPDRLQGRMISGLGVPDLRGGFGTPSFYSTAAGVVAGESENLVRLRFEGGKAATYLVGPRHPANRNDTRLDITLEKDTHGRSLTVHSDGSPRDLEVDLGRWSDWLRVRFKVGLLQSVSGVVRFHLVRLEPEVELYASAVHFDPVAPLFPISEPASYARELAGELGAYGTAGMVEEHTGLNNERLTEGAFLAQCDDVWREREAMMTRELARRDEGFFFCLFDTPDRIQHMFWRTLEPDHPANRRGPAAGCDRAVADCYRRADAVVARALDFVDDRTLLIVLSDHGFGTFRRGFHLNRWLYEQGLLALQPGCEPGDAAGDFLGAVDWDRTKAYALGLTGLYLNLRGREGRGIVAPEEAEALKAAIARGLGGLKDPERGEVAVRSVVTREALYAGPYVDEAPDLIVNCSPGYRLSWASSRGAVAAGGLFEDNTRKWSGDHIVDPPAVPGILGMNRPFNASGASLVDLAPTILSALGLPPTAATEGRSLLA